VKRYLLLCLLFALPGLALTGCRATYSADNIKQAITAICEKEYGVEVGVLTNDKTIGAVLQADELLQNDLTLSDRALQKIEHAMLTVSRVTLSSELHYDFFVIIARDAKTGLQVSFVRYLKDIRRLLTDDISRNEYFQRMLIEVEALPGGTNATSVRMKDYRLGDFLASQIAERMRQQLEQNVVVARLFKLEDVEGEYVSVRRAGERAPVSGTFRLTLLFHPQAPAFTAVANEALRENFNRIFLRTAQTVTRRYDFNGYEGLELVDGSGRRLAYFDRKEFTKDTVNTLMELIRSLKEKGK